MPEKKWFAALTAKRKNTVSVLQEEGMLKIFISHIVDTYRESAHFIYELFQNSDDVQATSIRFELKEGGILFAHNGKIGFSITDPAVERQEGTTPGHINAITTFSLSTKKEDIENKIGKFGIGFKSVFQYTNTPHVYNPPYCFRIENYMIPFEVDFTKDILKGDETTAFWLPFDKKDKTATQSFEEISVKLRQLKNPMLFLRNVKKIVIKNGQEESFFTKDIEDINPGAVPNVDIIKVTLNKDVILRFDQKLNVTDAEEQEHLLSISVGFVLDKKGNISADEEYSHYFRYAWCFFPTTQETRMNYIVNAPFILTPNREALREGRTENKQIIVALGKLMEAAIQHLKVLGYINEEFFTTLSIPQSMSTDFRPIGDKIIDKLKNGEFIPTNAGTHITVSNAYLCNEPGLAELLSFNNNEPLRKVTGRSNAHIVFKDGKLFEDRNLFVYFYKNLTSEKSELQAAWFGSKYETKILQNVTDEFRLLFFRYIAERSNVILGPNQSLWKKSFIPVYDGDTSTQYLVTPNNTKNEPQVFMGGPKIKGRYVAADYLTADPEIGGFLQKVLSCRLPDEFDDFYISLDRYDDDEISVTREEAVADIVIIMQLLSDLPNVKREKLKHRLKEISFLPVVNENQESSLENPETTIIYYPDNDLKAYFAKTGSVAEWVDISIFPNLDTRKEEFRSFFIEIGVEFQPYYDSEKKIFYGLPAFLVDISLKDSLYLARILVTKRAVINFKTDLNLLKESAWLFDSSHTQGRPDVIKYGALSVSYPHEFDFIHLDLGAIVDNQSQRYAGLNANEKALLEALGGSIDGLTAEEIKSVLAEFIRQKKKNSIQKASNNNDANVIDQDAGDPTTPQGLLDRWTKNSIQRNQGEFNNDWSSGKVIPSLPNSKDFWQDENQNDKEHTEDPGGFVSPQIIGMQYQRDQESKQQNQLNKQLELNYKRNQLIELAGQFEPYSFGWFKTLLELEDNFTAEDRVKRNPIHIQFNAVDFDEDGIMILSETVYIPPNIEDIGDISIQIFAGDEKITVKGEVISPKRRTLHIKLSNTEQLNALKSKVITRAVVEASSPDFILERLKSAFARLRFEDADNLKNPSFLPGDLKFIFGPPGTGKTTYISWLIGGKNPASLDFCGEPITPFMMEDLKVLVLTPTNKAADVLAERILENYEGTGDDPHWLIRFGQSQTLERSSIFVGDRNLKPWVEEQCTLITTIARYPYDYFKIVDREKLIGDYSLKDFDWDVIVFDEASMIGQAALLFVIYYASQINPKVKFYIGGDPFQIPPIIQFEYPYWSYLPDPAFDSEGKPIIDENGIQLAWKQDGGNIYSFVELMKDDSFSNPRTTPHAFQIHNLLTQYRSLVPLGALFSHYRYGGLLKHARTDAAIASNKKFAPNAIEVNSLPLNTINIIRFPVKKYGGIYRSRTVKGSPYHIYAAVFSVELIQYIQKNVTLNPGEIYRIGVISPYAMQSTLISKLLEKIGGGPVEVVSGTVHGFQGDECHLVIVVLNPPRNITRSLRSFLNKKNILNVAISRARDKMIFLTPYDPENELNLDDLHQVRWIERLAGKLEENRGFVTGYEATNIEKSLWGNENYIEDITFSTAHQNVNIYTDAIKMYEIRHDDNAIDVQVKVRKGIIQTNISEA
jgi:hypothetical protein